MSLKPTRFKAKSRRKAVFFAQSALLLTMSGFVAGCTGTGLDLSPREVIRTGYVADQDTIDLVPVGSSREQVLIALGSPSTTATFDNETLYYISQTRVRNAAFMKPKLVDQRILAIYLGADGRVERLADYGLKDGKIFDFISRTTPTGGIDASFVRGILSSLSGGGGAGQAAREVFGG